MSQARKLTRAEKRQIEAAIAKAKRQDKRQLSAQDSIPFQRMYPDGMGGSYRGYSREGRGYSREGGYSNARGRMNAQRDSRGRYSGADGDVEDIKRDMQRLMDKVEKM